VVSLAYGGGSAGVPARYVCARPAAGEKTGEVGDLSRRSRPPSRACARGARPAAVRRPDWLAGSATTRLMGPLPRPPVPVYPVTLLSCRPMSPTLPVLPCQAAAEHKSASADLIES